jgi:hypothetical protein
MPRAQPNLSESEQEFRSFYINIRFMFKLGLKPAKINDYIMICYLAL